MSKEVSVNVGVWIAGHVIDLRIPRLVRKAHLKRVLAEALMMMKIKLPVNFELILNGKPIKTNDSAVFDDYAIGDGDQIEIVGGIG